jgi:hypothetical protein
MSTVINPIARPFASTELSTDRKGHQAARVQLAVTEIWQASEPPAGISVAERNRALWRWFDARGLEGPSVRHLRRVFGGA